jgi:nucleoid-associated protein EbfC
MTPPELPDDSPDIDDVELLDPLEALGADDGPLAGLLGDGMPDLGSMLDGLSAVQSIQSAAYTGTAGGGLVRIVASGRMEVESVTISPEALGDDPDTDLLADLVLAALRDLTGQIADAQKQAMGPLGSILGQ